MVDFFRGDRGGDLGPMGSIIPSGQEYGLFGGSRSCPVGGRQFSGMIPPTLHSKSPGIGNIDYDMGELSFDQWSAIIPEVNHGERDFCSSGSSFNNLTNRPCNGGGPPTSRLFSAYTQTGNETCEEAQEAPHVALHLVSKLLDDESITTMGDTASSSQEEDESISPASSDHGLPSPSSLASSWPGVLDVGRPLSQTGNSLDTYSMSPWTSGGSASAYDVNQPMAYGPGLPFFLYDPGMNGGRHSSSASMPSPLSPIAPSVFPNPGAEQVPQSSSSAHPPSQKGPASAPVPVQVQGKRNSRHPHANPPSAPRTISGGKAEARRQRGHGHGRSRNNRSGDAYSGQDLGGSLPTSLGSTAPVAPSASGGDHGNHGNSQRQCSNDATEVLPRSAGQRKRRPHGQESRKCTPAVQQVLDLVESASDQLASLETQRKEVEQSLNRFCPSRRSGSNPSVRMPPNPSVTDRVVVEQLREHAKVEVLLSRIDRARSTPLNSTVGVTVDTWLSCLNELQSLRKQQRQKQPKRGHSLADSDATDLTPLLKQLNGISHQVQSALCGAFKSSFDDGGPRTSSSDGQVYSLRGVS